MEVYQVLVVGEDLYWERGPMKIMPLQLQGSDDGEELPVVNVIVSFSRDEQLRGVEAGVPVTV